MIKSDARCRCADDICPFHRALMAFEQDFGQHPDSLLVDWVLLRRAQIRPLHLTDALIFTSRAQVEKAMEAEFRSLPR